MTNDSCVVKTRPSVLTEIGTRLGLSSPDQDDCYPTSLYLATGAAIGICGVVLALMGNPVNTGFCVSCFLENIAGSLGLHGNIRMQYLRPEIIGFVLGSFATALARREFKAVGGGSPLLRFLVGGLLIVGCSVFIGCPLKMLMRLAAGAAI